MRSRDLLTIAFDFGWGNTNMLPQPQYAWRNAEPSGTRSDQHGLHRAAQTEVGLPMTAV
jgi:hypothetical protein